VKALVDIEVGDEIRINYETESLKA
jgi:hypothetical protein